MKAGHLPKRAICVFGIFLATASYGQDDVNDFTYASKGKRDPFIPLPYVVSKASGPASLDEFRLEGIIYDPSKDSLAVINGKVLRQGENVGPYTIQEIRKNSVSLRKGGEIFTLRLKAKKPTSDMPA